MHGRFQDVPVTARLAVMELVPYTDEDRWLTETLETDERVMAELGGPWPRDAIPAIHERRLKSIAAGTWWYTVVPEPGQPPVGMIGIFGSDLDGGPISEAGWSILPAHQGRGYASEALRILLERALADGRWGPIHAFPGVTNGPSNALCRKFGFALVGERTIDYGGRALRCNHWILEPSATVRSEHQEDRP
jgi:RimJ/RimL family protein N-acetyltransferase